MVDQFHSFLPVCLPLWALHSSVHTAQEGWLGPAVHGWTEPGSQGICWGQTSHKLEPARAKAWSPAAALQSKHQLHKTGHDCSKKLKVIVEYKAHDVNQEHLRSSKQLYTGLRKISLSSKSNKMIAAPEKPREWHTNMNEERSIKINLGND